MKSIRPIRYRFFVPMGALALAACSQQQAAPEPTPPPPPPPVSTPSPPPPPPAPTYADWRDAPATEGEWRSIKQGTAPAEAQFSTPGGDLLVELRCRSGQLEIRRAGTGTAELPMTFQTYHADGSRETISRTAQPVRPLMYQATVRASDPLLDNLAYSRGRFALEVSGLPTLYLPTRPEIIRVFQECRAS